MPQRLDAERLELALRGADLALWDIDFASGRTVVNARWHEMLGLPPDAQGRGDASAWLDRIHPEDRDRVLAAESAHREGLTPAFEAVYRLRHADGHWVWVLDRGRVLQRDDQGRALRMCGTHLDITERVLVEQALREREHELATVVAQMPGLVSRVDRHGVYRFVSPGYQRWFGRAPADIVGRSQRELLGEARHAELAGLIARALDGEVVHYESHVKTLDGERYVLGTLVPDRDSDGRVRGHFTFVFDISERKRAEETLQSVQRRLLQAQKLEALGTLAGGIAHDFNNIVAGILGHAELALQDLAPGDPAAAALAHIRQAGQRARSLVQQILSFSQGAGQPTAAIDLRAVVEEAAVLLQAQRPPGVQLVVDVGPAPLFMLGDATQLHQVLLNLCLNAWQALPEGRGRVQVTLDGDPTELRLQVADDGIGMDEATRARIFDPFFTTRPAGQGAGLGLAVVHGIVQAHRGRIVVSSGVGAGSRFSLHFARVAPAVAAPPAEPVVAARRGAGEHVLYVDDDELMREVVRLILQRAGWRVSTCAGAAQALALLDEPGQDVALLVSDFHMPETSGLALCAEVRGRWPGLPLVLSTGYLSEAQREEAAALGVREVMAKARTVEDLAAVVARAL